MQRNNPVNSVYLIALAVCSLLSVVNSLYQALIYAAVVVAVFLVSVSIVSMIEKVADKHVRFLMFALVSAALVTILKIVFTYINVSEIVLAADRLEFACLPCLLLAIVPIYFENNMTVGEFFIDALYMGLGIVLMLAFYGAIIEILGYGAIAKVSIKGFAGLEFFRLAYGKLIVLGCLTILFNIVRRTYLKNTRRFNMLVEKYKIQIREIRDTQRRVRTGERRDYNE